MWYYQCTKINIIIVQNCATLKSQIIAELRILNILPTQETPLCYSHIAYCIYSGNEWHYA